MNAVISFSISRLKASPLFVMFLWLHCCGSNFLKSFRLNPLISFLSIVRNKRKALYIAAEYAARNILKSNCSATSGHLFTNVLCNLSAKQ